MNESVAVIVWTVDPEGERRFLMRHNRPFEGYQDEWTICFGGIEQGEALAEAALREAKEEYGLKGKLALKDLDYSITWEDSVQGGPETAHFFAIYVQSIDEKIALNEESIGYDWLRLADAMKLMKYEDEARALTLVTEEESK